MAVGRNRKVKAMASSTHFGKRSFIGVIVGNRNLDPGFFFKLLDEFWIGVVTPVVKIQFPCRHRDAAEDEHQA